MRFLIALLILTFSCQSYGQVAHWKINQDLNNIELDFYNQKFKHFSQRKILDSALYYLIEANKRTEALGMYHNYFINLYTIGNYSQRTYQNSLGLDLLHHGLKIYSQHAHLIPDSLKRKTSYYIASIYALVSNLYNIEKAYNTSLDYTIKYVNLRKEIFGPNHTLTAHAYTTLGIQYEQLKDYEKALRCYHNTLNIYNRVPQNKGFRRYPLSNMGNVYTELGKYALALKHLNEALKISIQEKGKHAPIVAACYGNIGSVFILTSLYDLAQENYSKALFIRKKNLGEKHPFVARLYNNLGEVFQKQQKTGKALKFYQKALVSNISSFHDTLNIYALPINLKGIYQNDMLLTTLNAKASLLASLNKQKTNLEQAYKTYKLADRLIDKMRTSLLRKSDELYLTSTVASMYDKAMQVCWQLGKGDTTWITKTSEGLTQVPRHHSKAAKYNHYLSEAFYFAEKGKSSVLRKLANDASARIKSNIPEQTLEKERKLKSSILYYQRQLTRFKTRKTLRKRDSIDRQTFENRLFDLRYNYDQLLRELEQQCPEYYHLKHSNYIASVANVQKRLDAQTALIEYVLMEQELFSFVITKEGYWVHRQKANRKSLEKEIQKWFNNIKGGTDDSYLKRGHQFFRQFIQPIQRHFTNKKHLLIIPDGLLSHLPFEAFITQKQAPTGKSAEYPYLIRKWGVTLYPSASLALMQSEKRLQSYSQDFVGFAPVFEKQQAQTGIFRKDLKALPYTKKEIQNIHQLFTRQQKKSKIFTGEVVSEKMIKNLEGRYRFVHFATHGFLDDEMPVLAFYPDKKFDSTQVRNNDGALSLEEIFNLKFKANMVVLSSCQGGAGRNVKGEGILAITRGFVYLGTPHIIYTLWSVNDKDAAQLMIRFYELMSKGKSYREALRLAKLSMLEGPKTAWPKWWAGFTMMSKMR